MGGELDENEPKSKGAKKKAGGPPPKSKGKVKTSVNDNIPIEKN